MQTRLPLFSCLWHPLIPAKHPRHSCATSLRCAAKSGTETTHSARKGKRAAGGDKLQKNILLCQSGYVISMLSGLASTEKLHVHCDTDIQSKLSNSLLLNANCTTKAVVVGGARKQGVFCVGMRHLMQTYIMNFPLGVDHVCVFILSSVKCCAQKAAWCKKGTFDTDGQRKWWRSHLPQ